MKQSILALVLTPFAPFVVGAFQGLQPSLFGVPRTTTSSFALYAKGAKASAVSYTKRPEDNGPVMLRSTHRSGGWLPKDSRVVSQYITNLGKKAKENPQPLIKPVQNLKDMVNEDPSLCGLVAEMFSQAALAKSKTPDFEKSVDSWEEFIVLLNHIVTTQAPRYTICSQKTDPLDPCGLVGFPINALLDWPMATIAGYTVFSNQLFNQQFKKVLAHWTHFLASSDSAFVLTQDDLSDVPTSLAWLGEDARQEIIDTANTATNAVVKSASVQTKLWLCILG